MSTIPTKPASIECDAAGKNIQLMLGGAITLLWDYVPQELQAALVKQAAFMADRPAIVQAEFQVQGFIAANKRSGI